MPLVPETKMADVGKQSREPIGQENHVVSAQNYDHNFNFHLRFLEPTLWQEFSLNTLIFQHSPSFSQFHSESQHTSLSHFHLQGQHTLSSVTSRENTLTESTHPFFLPLTSSSQPPRKYILHAAILFLVILFRWNFIKP